MRTHTRARAQTYTHTHTRSHAHKLTIDPLPPENFTSTATTPGGPVRFSWTRPRSISVVTYFDLLSDDGGSHHHQVAAANSSQVYYKFDECCLNGNRFFTFRLKSCSNSSVSSGALTSGTTSSAEVSTSFYTGELRAACCAC